MHVFSGFYAHPAMLNEDGWTLMKDMKILVDVDISQDENIILFPEGKVQEINDFTFVM